MDKMRRAIARTSKDERGVESVAMLIVIPVICVLIFALLDIGMMLQARMRVENVARDTVRRAAADGGNFNPRTNPYGKAWDTMALNALYREGKCTQSGCTAKPSVNCRKVTTPTGTVLTSNTARNAGDLITCTVNYPYKPINSALLKGPLGLGFGEMLKPFTIVTSARAETGTAG